MEGDRRVYFMEDKYGRKGNLMPRDIVSKCIYDVPSQVYLDISFLGKKRIEARLPEIWELCRTYAGLDISRESIPVYPSVHYFMGGLAVDRSHKTSIGNLYAVGECASMYHGANRLGGNSLLSAVYGGKCAAKAIKDLPDSSGRPDFEAYISRQEGILQERLGSKSRFSAVYIRHEIAKLMNDCLGITRNGEKLARGIEGVDYYLSVSDKLVYDSDVSPYIGYSLRPMLILARGILSSALAREETRGAHIREDHPERRPEYGLCSLCEYQEGKYRIFYGKEDDLCW